MYCPDLLHGDSDNRGRRVLELDAFCAEANVPVMPDGRGKLKEDSRWATMKSWRASGGGVVITNKRARTKSAVLMSCMKRNTLRLTKQFLS